MEIMGVDSTVESGTVYFDGIVGMAAETFGGADLLIDELYDEGHIDERVFSVYYTTETNDNHIYFGGYSEEHKEEEFEYISLKSGSSHWTISASEATYGGDTFASDLTSGILDTGTSLMYLPMGVY